MSNDTVTVPTSNRVRGLVLLGGPALSVLAARSGLESVGVGVEWAGWMLATMLVVAWSPLFCSVPALLLQDARDEVLPGAPVWRRAVGMLPALLERHSPVRTDQLLALYGFAGGAALLVL
jgi:hypothetical protein